MKERWFGATGRKVPEIALAGELDVEGALVLDAWNESAHDAFEAGTPIVVLAAPADDVVAVLSHPEVACALVSDPALLELDLVRLTYGS